MERQIPKNVRQIGNVSDNTKIYVEDYVDTFFIQLCEKCEKAGNGPVGAFLIGDIQSGPEEEFVYIYGAVQMQELKLSGNDYVIEESTWKHAFEDCRQYFEDGEMLGWFIAHPGVPLTPEQSTIKLHKKSFPKKNTVLIMKDPVEGDESYFVHKMNDLMEIGGHYTYYEKNPCMQNYMIACRKKNGASPTENVEDRAAKDFRNLVRKRGEGRKGKKSGGFLYAASACLILVLVIMGVSMLNSFDRMNSAQNTLDTLAGSAETVETGGIVTAVTGEDDEGDGQEQKEDQADTGDVEALQQQETEAADPDAAAQGEAAEGQETAEQGTEEQETEGQAVLSSGANGSDGVYVVEKGDTLAIISRKMYGDVSHVEAICKMNGITDGNLIYVGQKLLLP